MDGLKPGSAWPIPERGLPSPLVPRVSALPSSPKAFKQTPQQQQKIVEVRSWDNQSANFEVPVRSNTQRTAGSRYDHNPFDTPFDEDDADTPVGSPREDLRGTGGGPGPALRRGDVRDEEERDMNRRESWESDVPNVREENNNNFNNNDKSQWLYQSEGERELLASTPALTAGGNSNSTLQAFPSNQTRDIDNPKPLNLQHPSTTNTAPMAMRTMAEVEEDLRRWSMRRSTVGELPTFNNANASRGDANFTRESTVRSRASTTWSRTTAAESDLMGLRSPAGGVMKKKGADGKPVAKVLDTSFLTDDWESLMESPAYRETIFFSHCAANDLTALRYLMMSFRDQSFLVCTNKRGETGLAVAATHGAAEVASFLVRKGASVHAVDKDGRTPLMMSVIGGHLEVCEMLLAKGADTAPRDKKGQTALHFALPYVSGARSGRKSLDGMKGEEDKEEERVEIAVRLLRYNLENHKGEDHLGMNYEGQEGGSGEKDGGGGGVGGEKGSGNEEWRQPPPNGGRTAWLQVLGTFLIYFNTAGVSSSFGVYQTFYTETFGLATTQASTIGSIQSFLLTFTSLLGGPLYDAGLYKMLLLVGSSLVVSGTFFTSLGSVFYQLLLAQGVAIGLGGGLFGFLGPSILSTYFSTKLPLASGIGALGGGIAGIMYPILFRNIEPLIGFGWTVRVFAIVVAATLVIVILVMKPRQRPAGKRVFWDPTALRDVPYLVFVAGNFAMNLGLYVPFSYVSTFATDNKLADAGLALYLVAIINGGSLFGRVLPTLLATRVGPLNMIIVMGTMTALVGSSLLLVTSLPALLFVCVLYGFATGAYFALQPVTLISLCPDPTRVGTRVGMASAMLAVGNLPGATIAGALLDSIGFKGVWLWTGATTGLGAALMFTARVKKAGLHRARV